MDFIFEEILEKYPHVWQIDSIKWQTESFFMVGSPFANCQTFCFNNAKTVLKIDNSDMLKFMKMVYQRVEKRQFVIDVNDSYSEEILNKFKPFIRNIISTPYKSTNGSSMILHLIQMETKMLD